MNLQRLTHTNLRFFSRYYKLIALAELITIAVIVGSLVVGDSVRATLTQRVTERLGNTETIVFSRHSFMEDTITDSPLFEGSARGILFSNGFISQNGKLIPVSVWGVDDKTIPEGAAKVNRALHNEMEADNPDIVLRLPASGLIPSGSLFVTENYTTSLRLSLEGIATVEEGGNISLKNEQIIPFNLFVNREELANTLETPGKINLILSDVLLSVADLDRIWEYPLSGLAVHRKNDFTEITSDRVFLQETVIETICRNNREPNRLFSYLANGLNLNGRSIPYSFVTAVDRYKEEVLQPDEIILSDYSAHCLQATVGDRIQLSYFISQDLKTLQTDTVSLQVKKIVPLAELAADSTLSADFPGLSNVERCTDWNSDLPIDMNLITDEDEKYWELHRGTPKAILAYEAVAGKWGNAYGHATAIRITDSDADLSALRAEMFGIRVVHPRETGLYLAKNGVDFSGLFLALGFFIIVSALLLMHLPLSEMLYRRQPEINLLKALGYTRKRITRLLWKESGPIVFASSILGVMAGLLYTSLIMWLLGNVWKGATHTDGFSVYPDIKTIVAGFLVGMILSLGFLHRTIILSLKKKKTDVYPKRRSLKKKKAGVILSSIVTVGIIGINSVVLQSVTLFVIIGVIMIGTAALWIDFLICRNGAPASGSFHTDKLIWSTLLAHKKQAILSFLTLSTGVFIVFSVGLNRKGFADSSQIKTGTGGYSLWCESSIPIFHNMATEDGRSKLSLTSLPDDTEVLQCLRYGADDASCLNLNKVTTPSVLGVDMNRLLKSDFQIVQSLHSSDRNEAFRQMQTKTGTVYPALVDETVLTWSLMMNLGDTIWYEGDRGQSVGLRLTGTLANSIFQGNILVDRSFFSEIWGETTGSEIILLKVKEPEKEEVKTLLAQALNEYGVSVTTTNDRLKQFNTVTDTYLTIFLTLGGLGLLLGIMSFIIVIRKNLSARRHEIGLYRTLGFTDSNIASTLYKENSLVPLYAIGSGVVSSLVAVSIHFMNTGVGIWLTVFFFTLLFTAGVVIFVRKSVKKEMNHKSKNKIITYEDT